MQLDDFIHRLAPGDLPSAVQRHAQVCLLDLVATAVAGTATPLAQTLRDHALEHFAGRRRQARLLLCGERASPVGAALAGGGLIDSFDAHDGHVLTKGHAGAAVLPGLLAFLDGEARDLSGADFLTVLTLGYEVAIRAGIATHASSPDYHTSGSWNALGVAAMGARLLGLDPDRTRHALGIAEYHGPRSQMMRCIDFPTMLKDGSDWGAAVGVSSAYLAAESFTGAPALVVESPAQAALWADLAQRWRLLELYFKPFGVCRWAQPPIVAALRLRRAESFDPSQVQAVRVVTFHAAARLAVRRPATTEEAQYSLPFPVAVALAKGGVEAPHIMGKGLRDPQVLAIADRIVVGEDEAYNAAFPARRLCRVEIELADGRRLVSPPTEAWGDPERPLAESDFLDKARRLVEPVKGPAWLARLRALIEDLPGAASVRPLLDHILAD